MGRALFFALTIMAFACAFAMAEMKEGLVMVKSGCFEMGDQFDVGKLNEQPLHKVCVPEFYIGRHEVTVVEYAGFVNETGYETDAETIKSELTWKNPGYSQTDSHPVVCVTFKDSTEYLLWMTKKTGKTHRLPTEAEWEYAARGGGQNLKYSGTNDDGKLGDYAWYRENSSGAPKAVGLKKPNPIGIFDMSGNVMEWVSDWFDEKFYAIAPIGNPRGPENGNAKAVRGGSWHDGPGYSRTSSRVIAHPKMIANVIGFRAVVADRP